VSDVDIGPALWLSLVLFAVLPLATAALSVTAVIRLVLDPTSRLAIGGYLMLTSVLVTPAPILWGDVHLGFKSSQALEIYGNVAWAAGAVVFITGLANRLRQGQQLAMVLGCILAAIIGAWALSGPSAALVWSGAAGRYPCTGADCADVPTGVRQAVALALIPLVGTVVVAVLFAWLQARVHPSTDLPRASLAGVVLALITGAYVYVRGPALASSPTYGVDLLVMAGLCVLVLCGWGTSHAT